ncbi:precorrin-3B C(17)-methyltransferase [Pseudomonas oryzihabitans]|uniref:Cobalt-precorrin 5A hydrolase/precorrin-3B C17-methyltransferase n=1 Tax=Pseudomonas oryzihabitans TaxID=47885 RepID=A0AAJ2EWR1_9PSED|nr:precorrin-3B C(17)-methyltransferase [Pseudomonas psychrotolerans]MDR6235033.1 cobalt-precorrin 5A hydrolase/precorrin-3B C17-methyltransferase [Pseudomonas psychrotolerans]
MEGLSPAIVILGPGALATARRLQAGLPGSQVHGLAGRVEGDVGYNAFGDHLRDLYRQQRPLVVLCAAGIVIRTLAPLLDDKTAEPPVLAVAEDGSAVVPLLGGLAGANRLARSLGALLQVAPAITTSGELRFGTCLLDPPTGYALADVDVAKHRVADLLAGEPVRIEGEAPWLDKVPLARDPAARQRILVSPLASTDDHTLLIHPRAVLVAVRADVSATAVSELLASTGYAPGAVAVLLARAEDMAAPALAELSQALDVPLRFVAAGTPDFARATVDRAQERGIALHLHPTPLDADGIGQRRGRLSVVGLGPGAAELMAPVVRRALDQAQDVLGYATYVKMAGPLRPDQLAHASDNREELQRARHAFELAASGRQVVMVSSGDPGVFAMAAAVLEVLEGADDPRWAAVELEILPGITAAMASAALAGAPLGHDFCLISLSDNLKPWAVIEQRLRQAAAADLAMAFYNPISKARPHQLERALDVLRSCRPATTPVILGRDVGRPGGGLEYTSLGALRSDMVDSRTLVILGSSHTRRFPRADGGEWVYTPRWYDPDLL